jgi:hypothetical protein
MASGWSASAVGFAFKMITVLDGSVGDWNA